MLIPTEHCSTWSGVLAAFAVLSLPALCAAQTSAPRASLVVTRSDGAQACPDAAALAEQVRAVTGANVIGVGGSTPTEPVETWVQVAIAHDFGGYRAQISTMGRHHGTRTLEDLGPGCSSLADALAVTIAIFLDPYADAPPPIAAPNTPAPPAPPKPIPESMPSSRPELFVVASGGVALSLLEHSAATLGVGAGLEWRDRWSLAVGGSYVFPDTKQTTGGTIRLRLSYASVQGCGRAFGAGDGARVDWCVAPLFGSLAGEGQGYAYPESNSVLWFALAAGPQAAFPLAGPFSAVVAAQAVLPLSHRGFDERVRAEQRTVFSPPAVAGTFCFGVRGAL